MITRPGTQLARRPLHFFLAADCSGSMAADGKVQALNTAVREVLPHLAQVAGENPHVDLLFSALAFSSGVRWHVDPAVPVEQVAWSDLTPGGYTDMGAALSEIAGRLQVGSVVKDAEGRLLGEYFFRDLRFDPKFKPDTFTRAGLRR